MRHSKSGSCTNEKEGKGASKRKVHGDKRKADSGLDRGEQARKKECCAKSCKDGPAPSAAADPGCSTSSHAAPTQGTPAGAENSSLAAPAEQPGNDEREANLPKTGGADSALLNEVPFRPRHGVCSRNGALCASPSHSSCMCENRSEHKTHVQKIDEDAPVQNDSANSPVACRKADKVHEGPDRTGCSPSSGDSKKTASVVEISRKIDHMARSIMERPGPVSGGSTHAAHHSTGARSSEGTPQQSRENDASTGNRCTTTKATCISVCPAIPKTQYKIFFTSEDAKNAGADASVLLVTLPQDRSGFLRKKALEKAESRSAPRLYKSNPMIRVCSSSAAEDDGAGTGPGDVRLVKTELKDTIQVECTAPQYFDPLSVPGNERAAAIRHVTLEDLTSHEDSLCDLVEKLSTKNSGEDVGAPIVRDVHYVDPEVPAKDRRRERKGFLCRFFSAVFGCCA